jgi:hypothetical protein
MIKKLPHWEEGQDQTTHLEIYAMKTHVPLLIISYPVAGVTWSS